MLYMYPFPLYHTNQYLQDIKLKVSHPDVFKDRIKTVKHNLFILVVEFTWVTGLDLV
jgi:hypothetical protein